MFKNLGMHENQKGAKSMGVRKNGGAKNKGVKIKGARKFKGIRNFYESLSESSEPRLFCKNNNRESNKNK